MSLQGSFETIALTDVMALLASSNKSGELRVVGGHVEGRLWMHDGCLVASKVGKAHDHVDAMFELMRLTEGNFVFKDGVEAPEPAEATPVEPVVQQAEERLREWREIEGVVPSLEHRVRLVADLPTPEVTLTGDEWHLVMAIALAGTVHGVLEELALGQFTGCRGIRHLVDAGLVLVEPPRARPSASDPARSARRAAAANGSSAPPNGAGGSPRVTSRPASVPTDLASGDGALGALAALASAQVAVAKPTMPAPATPSAFELPSAFGAAEDEYPPPFEQHFPLVEEHDAALPFTVGQEPAPVPGHDEPAAEVLRRRRPRKQSPLHDQDPEAGATPARSTNGTDSASGDGADQHQQDSGGDSINRGLLLKFLSSVRS